MKIKSDFKDYYDRCQGYGTDDIVYMRYLSGQNINNTKLIFKIYIGHDIECEIAYIGFCGKVYPVIKFWYCKRGYVGLTNGGYFYNLESIDKFVNTLDSNIREDYFNYTPFYKMGNRNSLKKIFDTVITNAYSEEPVFTINSFNDYDYSEHRLKTKISVSINCNISKYNFGKLFPPNLAYQEIHSFLNNKAIPIKPIPKLDDKIMAEIKGFDKWSFRKESTKKKIER